LKNGCQLICSEKRRVASCYNASCKRNGNADENEAEKCPKQISLNYNRLMHGFFSQIVFDEIVGFSQTI
jgi:hypothetical protein